MCCWRSPRMRNISKSARDLSLRGLANDATCSSAFRYPARMATSHTETPRSTVPLHRGRRPFERFFDAEAGGGLLLLATAAAAFLAANSPLAERYHRLWSTRLTIGVPNYVLSLTLHDWVSEALM